MQEPPWAFSTFWMYTVLVDEAQYGIDSRTLLRRLGERSIQTRPVWQPLHRSPAYSAVTRMPICPVTERLYRDALSLPSSVGLQAEDVLRVVETLASPR